MRLGTILVMPKRLTLRVNGEARVVEVEPQTPLLYVLRNDLGLCGPKFGCGMQQCGSCMVLIDGAARMTCLLPVSAVEGQEIVTIEGIGTPETPHPIQQAFIAEQAAQCGYCTNGVIMAAKALLDRNPNPSESQIREALKAVLCRCGTQSRVIRAVQRAAKELAKP